MVDELGDEHSPPPPPPPRAQYYGNFNFILLDSSVYYFYKKYTYRFCGTGVDYTKPPRLNLMPSNLTKFDEKELRDFLTLNITDSISNDFHFSLTISSPTDTIRNEAFKVITDILKSKKFPRYYIRNWTEEEKFVTIAKIENKKYNADSVDWKIGFDEN